MAGSTTSSTRGPRCPYGWLPPSTANTSRCAACSRQRLVDHDVQRTNHGHPHRFETSDMDLHRRRRRLQHPRRRFLGTPQSPRRHATASTSGSNDAGMHQDRPSRHCRRWRVRRPSCLHRQGLALHQLARRLPVDHQTESFQRHA